MKTKIYTEKAVLAVINESEEVMNRQRTMWSGQSESFRFAYILTELGVKTIHPQIDWWNGDPTGLENLRVETHSIVMHPYVGVKTARDIVRPLPFFIADHHGYPLCGCASPDTEKGGYMQMCLTNRKKGDGNPLENDALRKWAHSFHEGLMLNFWAMASTKVRGVTPTRIGARKKKA